jgi:hypothetical protein
MTATSILDELRLMGRESTRKVLMKHGAAEPCFGVKIADLKIIQKRVKVDYRLALELYYIRKVIQRDSIGQKRKSAKG